VLPRILVPYLYSYLRVLSIPERLIRLVSDRSWILEPSFGISEENEWTWQECEPLVCAVTYEPVLTWWMEPVQTSHPCPVVCSASGRKGSDDWGASTGGSQIKVSISIVLDHGDSIPAAPVCFHRSLCFVRNILGLKQTSAPFSTLSFQPCMSPETTRPQPRGTN